MGLDEVSGENSSGSNTTVVGTLGGGVSTLGPLEGPSIRVEERVLLLESKPGDVSLDCLHHLVGVMSVVGRVGGTVVVVGLTKDEDVVSLSEGVLEDGDRSKVDVGVVAGGLAGGRSVEVPLCKAQGRTAEMVRQCVVVQSAESRRGGSTSHDPKRRVANELEWIVKETHP